MARARHRQRRCSRGAAAAFTVSALAAAAVLGLLGWFAWCAASAVAIPDPAMPDARDEDGFPQVDWAYWQDVNPDVIGWLSIPGTEVSCALVQAHADAPTYYLSHDVHGMQNYHGCPYLDASCEQEGLDSRNAVVFGHNIQNGASMFAPIAQYGQPAFAQEHAVVLLQTPEWKRALRVAGAAIALGSDRTKRTQFDDEADFRAWFADRMGECCVRLREEEPACCVTLVTCSYGASENERTLVYAVP